MKIERREVVVMFLCGAMALAFIGCSTVEKTLNVVNSGLDVVNNTLEQLAESQSSNGSGQDTYSSGVRAQRDSGSYVDGDFVEPVGNSIKVSGGNASSVRYGSSSENSDTWADGELVEPWCFSVPVASSDAASSSGKNASQSDTWNDGDTLEP